MFLPETKRKCYRFLSKSYRKRDTVLCHGKATINNFAGNTAIMKIRSIRH